MITIPVWVFVLLIILASITALELLLILITGVASIFTPTFEHEPEEIDCPDELEPADKNDNPEYIPPVSRED